MFYCCEAQERSFRTPEQQFAARGRRFQPATQLESLLLCHPIIAEHAAETYKTSTVEIKSYIGSHAFHQTTYLFGSDVRSRLDSGMA